jgi:cobalt/nickel transport system permease protein
MAHIHLEDGSFTLFWAAVWWAVALAIIGLALFRLRLWKKTDSHRITVAAFCTAAIFAIFLVEIPVAGGIHLNMTPLAGILTGPFSGCLIVFVVNILSAAVGHGGWSMIGANTLVNAAEAVVAFAIFRLLAKITAGPFFPAAVATFTGLLCGNAIMVALILVSGIQGVT